jgi:hypothetical protein
LVVGLPVSDFLPRFIFSSETKAEAPTSEASPKPQQKRVLTQAEKEEIIRRRKREKLLNPDRLNYIVGVTRELGNAPPSPSPSQSGTLSIIPLYQSVLPGSAASDHHFNW